VEPNADVWLTARPTPIAPPRTPNACRPLATAPAPGPKPRTQKPPLSEQSLASRTRAAAGSGGGWGVAGSPHNVTLVFRQAAVRDPAIRVMCTRAFDPARCGQSIRLPIPCPRRSAPRRATYGAGRAFGEGSSPAPYPPSKDGDYRPVSAELSLAQAPGGAPILLHPASLARARGTRPPQLPSFVCGRRSREEPARCIRLAAVWVGCGPLSADAGQDFS
jgi:hypothetical protein